LEVVEEVDVVALGQDLELCFQTMTARCCASWVSGRLSKPSSRSEASVASWLSSREWVWA
jgi:hypothetical protein